MRSAGIVIAAFCVALAGIVVAPLASAAEVDLTIHCDQDVQLLANVGDSVVMTMGSGCGVGDGGYLGNEGTTWPSGESSPAYQGFFGAATFIHPQSPWDSWDFSGDWGTFSDGSGTTSVTATLLNTNGNADPIHVGAILAVMSPEQSGAPFAIVYAGSREADSSSPMWEQSVGRASSSADCPDGYTPSWDTWPNNHTGGYVCNRFVPMYGG